jgi:hypothetical protein
MHRALKTLLLAVIAAAATLASTAVSGRVTAIQLGNAHCENECDFLAAGWPFPFPVDGPGVSPSGSVDLVGAVLGGRAQV